MNVQFRFAAVIAAIPVGEESGSDSPQWQCAHRHKTEESAALCLSREVRRSYFPAPDRQGRVKPEWRSVYARVVPA